MSLYRRNIGFFEKFFAIKKWRCYVHTFFGVQTTSGTTVLHVTTCIFWLCNLPGKGYIGGLDKNKNSDSTPFLPTVIHSHSRPIQRPYPTSPTPTFHHYIRNNFPSTLPSFHPYPALGSPLRANRIPAPFSALSRYINNVLFNAYNVTLLPQNSLFLLNFIQKHRIIVQF